MNEMIVSFISCMFPQRGSGQQVSVNSNNCGVSFSSCISSLEPLGFLRVGTETPVPEKG